MRIEESSPYTEGPRAFAMGIHVHAHSARLFVWKALVRIVVVGLSSRFCCNLCVLSRLCCSSAKVCLSINFAKRRKTQIRFDFNFESDTPEAVASEMVTSLRLPNQGQTRGLIVAMLRQQLDPLRKEWQRRLQQQQRDLLAAQQAVC